MGGESALLLGLDAARLGELFGLRPDLSARTVAQLSRALPGDRAGKLDLPGLAARPHRAGRGGRRRAGCGWCCPTRWARGTTCRSAGCGRAGTGSSSI
ncbi:hypothetical protein ACFSTC_39270 [Nonomuraea ferruginea]